MRKIIIYVVTVLVGLSSGNAILHDYGDALAKSILFFEGQRSGKLPATQRLTWRRDSALGDGLDNGVDLTGGYYDAGDNVKFNFPMAFSTTMMAWGVIEYGKSMGPELEHAVEAVRWSTDYFLKATATPGVVYAQLGDPNADHNCWERPEDMDTPRTVYAVTQNAPGSEVSAEIAAALAASSSVFKAFGDKLYAKVLLKRASEVFEFADKYRGSYNDSIAGGACPFYCDYSGYQIEAGISEFGWDAKHAGISVLISKLVLNNTMETSTPFLSYSDTFICSLLPDSPTNIVQFSPGGLLVRQGVCNLQHATGVSFLVLVYARYLKKSKHVIRCNDKIITQKMLVGFTKKQVDYILGSNPLSMSYMVGYGSKFPRRIHHRASSLPSVAQHPGHIACKDGTPYFMSDDANPNELTGAVVGGPNVDDSFSDDRLDSTKSEPATYINAPLLGLLAYFKSRSSP
ncbi:hypothetical protein SASPL_110694 [Salvia splendens]|uniref:Endoglucanase n=1 Tax=Salvia splendens TaxID=180675 RepID=A0A8X8Y5B2_SALSN|nr:hypothetical protein SASPL_110694 [Salvia splendens]